MAYFKEGKPVKGNTDFSLTYKGATWLFANKANADFFKAMPEKYEPQYGGYCAYGCSQAARSFFQYRRNVIEKRARWFQQQNQS